MKTAADIADEIITRAAETSTDIRRALVRAIEADRAQRAPRPTVCIVQNDAGDVVDSFQDADEATAAYQDGYTVAEETPWAPGEYAEWRIGELTRRWEDAVNYGEVGEYHARASDYALSEDDWRAGLDDDEAAEIARLIEWRDAQ